MNKTILMDNEHAYDEWAAAYDLAENQTRDMEIKVAQQILGTKQYSQVIELGCGTGKNTIWLSKLTSCLIGIDFSREMLKIARQKVKNAHVTFVHGNLLKPWNFGNKAELITSSLVLEHIDNLDYIFREIARFKKIFILYLMFLVLLSTLDCFATANNRVEITPFLKLSPCKNQQYFLCGNLPVPVDYIHPELGKIELPVMIHRASQKSMGYLFFNFGGPWANNVDVLPSIIKNRLTKSMVNNFDIVVINPRGTRPNLIQCNTKNTEKLEKIDEAMKKLFSQGTINEAEAIYELAKQKQKICQYDKLYQYANSANTVQDIEELRNALDVSKLNLYMVSYGTRLGLAYLVKYPQHVQNIVLDGNIAPSNQLSSLISARALGGVMTFNSFFQHCFEAGNKCILSNLISDTPKKSASGLINNFNQFLVKTKKNKGVPTSNQYNNRPITSEMIENLVFAEMQPSAWKSLARAIYNAEKNQNGDELMKIYIANTGYDPKNNRYSIDNNATRPSVICGDYLIPSFEKKLIWLNFIDKINSKYSKIGTASTLWLAPMCINWPAKSTPLLPKPLKIKSSDISPNVLIIGNAEDPMTPFENALAVRDYLKKFGIQSTILKWNGLSHTAMITDSPLSSCVFKNVDKFLSNKNFPNYIECNDWQNPFTQENAKKQ